jgi:hypothetical protein
MKSQVALVVSHPLCRYIPPSVYSGRRWPWIVSCLESCLALCAATNFLFWFQCSRAEIKVLCFAWGPLFWLALLTVASSWSSCRSYNVSWLIFPAHHRFFIEISFSSVCLLCSCVQIQHSTSNLSWQSSPIGMGGLVFVLPHWFEIF